MADRSSYFWRAVGVLPLVGRLKEVPAEALREAWAEIWTTTVFAAMPFWFPLVGLIILTNPPDLLEGIRNGELLIYAATLVGPLAYIITKRYGKFVAKGMEAGEPDVPLTYPFPNGRLAVTIAMVICIISGIVITLQKLQASEALKGIKLINGAGLAISSIILFIVSTILLFCVSAYRNFMELLSQDHSHRISRAQQEDEKALADQWRARQGEQ